MSYSLGAAQILTAAQANRDMGWTKAKLHSYWDARAKACQQFSDEGECLAQVERHVPVTIGGLGTTASDISDVSSAITVIAGLIGNPDATLRRQGPQLVQAIDRHLLDPLLDDVGRKMVPYVLKYVLPPLSILYVLSGLGAYYSHQTATKGRMKSNRRRRKRRTSRRR